MGEISWSFLLTPKLSNLGEYFRSVLAGFVSSIENSFKFEVFGEFSFLGIKVAALFIY